jgi:hypothetical protein
VYICWQKSSLPKQDSYGTNAINHDLVLTIESLTAAALLLLWCVLLLGERVHLVQYNYHTTICGKHIIMNLILQSTLNYYSFLSEIH